MTTAREFHLGHLLSITTGYLFPVPGVKVPSHVLYEILNFMTGDSNQTVQLFNAADEVKPRLLGQLPWLNEIHFQRGEVGPENIQDVLDRLVEKYGAWHKIYPLHSDDHIQVDPVAVIHAINPDIIFIELPIDNDLEEQP